MKRRRKSIPDWVKNKVLKQQYWLCDCGCGQTVTIETAEFDHHPAIALREWDARRRDTIPAQNDPRYLFARTPDCHAVKTYHPRGPHTSIGSDRHAIDKAKRIASGGRKRKSAPFPGSIDSPFYTPVNGPDAVPSQAERSTPWRPCRRWPVASEPKKRCGRSRARS